MRIVLDIGHSRTSPGACNKNLNICEFPINERLAKIIKPMIEARDKDIDVLINYRSPSVSLVNQINMLRGDYVVAMHFNAFNTKATGTEVLYWHASEPGKKLARIFQDSFLKHLKLHDRGIKGINADARGGGQLMGTVAPCIICEPLFIDNDKDAEFITERDHILVDAYLEAIRKIKKGL